jgi:chaperonin GroEL (HSP60 family)
MLADIAILTGGSVITQDAGLSLDNIQLNLLRSSSALLIKILHCQMENGRKYQGSL